MKKALLIFAKLPVPGKVKTRLAPPLLPEEAAELYACMLRDTLAKVEDPCKWDCIIHYADSEGAPAFFRGIAPDMAIFPQNGTTLGERMLQAFKQAFSSGYRSVAIIGTDSPDLPCEYIETAFDVMEKGLAEVVIGPSDDGGYYLLAMQKPLVELFCDIEWSSDRVLCATLARAGAVGVEVELLPVWYDIDTVADLRRPGLQDKENGAPLTRDMIRRLLPAVSGQ